MLAVLPPPDDPPESHAGKNAATEIAKGTARRVTFQPGFRMARNLPWVLARGRGAKHLTNGRRPKRPFHQLFWQFEAEIEGENRCAGDPRGEVQGAFRGR